MYSFENEIAIRAGETALKSLREAKRELEGARTWGFFDILGGKTFTGLLKHMKLAKAQRIMDEARRDLEAFKAELSYIPAIDIEISSFLAIVDFMFDGLLADIMVQSRINKALNETNEAIRRTEMVLSRLRA